MATTLPPRPSWWMIGVTPVPAVMVIFCIAFPGCSNRPETESKQTTISTPTVEAARPTPSGADRHKEQGRDTKTAKTDDPISAFFGATLRVVDKATNVATSGADEKSLQGFIEATADGVRTGLNVADEVLPPLDPGIARKFGSDFRNSVIAEHAKIDDRQPIDLVMPIWHEVVQASREQPESLTITLVEDPEINAFAFVGRNVVVNRGFIEFATSCSRPKDVIRFTLAHELGHIVCGHTDILFRRVVAAEQIVPGAGVAPAIIESIVKQTPISQAAEREADCFARRMHLANRWSLEGGREFFTRVQRMSGRPSSGMAIESLFGSHPDESRRLDLLTTGAGCDDD